MSKEFQIRDGNLIASFDLENEDGDIDFCKLLKVSHGVADEIGMFVDYVATNKIIKDQSKQISDLETKLAEREKKAYSRGHSQRDIANEIKLNALREDVANKEKRIVELKQQLAKKDALLKKYVSTSCPINQDKISFAVDILEELAGCSNYINSKLDFECGSYVSEKSIRDKIKYLKGNKYE